MSKPETQCNNLQPFDYEGFRFERVWDHNANAWYWYHEVVDTERGLRYDPLGNYVSRFRTAAECREWADTLIFYASQS